MPSLKPDAIRLRVEACGLCGTDLHWDSKPLKESPFGHEVAGTVQEMLTPAQCAVPYEGMKPDIACLSEPLGVALDVLRLSDIGVDSNVLVMP